MLVASMIYPLTICAACVVTSIIGVFFVKLGADGSIMGALYKGLIATGLLSIGGLALATQFVTGWGVFATIANFQRSPGLNLFALRDRRVGGHGPPWW